MMEIFTRTYIDESEFPHKVKTGILKEGEYVYEVRLIKKPIEKLQLVKRQVNDTFTFGDLKHLGETIFFTEEEADKCYKETRKELGW